MSSTCGKLELQVQETEDMEVEGEDGSRFSLENRSLKVFGRGSGFTSDDRTVSRRHILFDIKPSDDKNNSQTESGVSFEVIGRNPTWLRKRGDGEITIFRRFGKGEMAPGDSFCVGGKSPIWFNLKKIDEFEQEDQRISWSKSEFGSSLGTGSDFELGIDPVREFGFVVTGHAFDSYTKRIIRDPKKWKWFLDEPQKNSDDDEKIGGKGRRRGTKRRKSEEGDDDDWTGESDDDREMMAKVRKIERPKYSTRSKDVRKVGRKSAAQRVSEEDEDEEDETLGGFIVEEDATDEEQTNEEEEEEEVMDEDDDE